MKATQGLACVARRRFLNNNNRRLLLRLRKIAKFERRLCGGGPVSVSQQTNDCKCDHFLSNKSWLALDECPLNLGRLLL